MGLCSRHWCAHCRQYNNAPVLKFLSYTKWTVHTLLPKCIVHTLFPKHTIHTLFPKRTIHTLFPEYSTFPQSPCGLFVSLPMSMYLAPSSDTALIPGHAHAAQLSEALRRTGRYERWYGRWYGRIGMSVLALVVRLHTTPAL